MNTANSKGGNQLRPCDTEQLWQTAKSFNLDKQTVLKKIEGVAELGVTYLKSKHELLVLSSVYKKLRRMGFGSF